MVRQIRLDQIDDLMAEAVQELVKKQLYNGQL